MIFRERKSSVLELLKLQVCQEIEAVVEKCSVKKMLLGILQNSLESTFARVSSLIKACNFIEKETLAQVLFCEFCKISKNIFFHRTSLVAASKESI